MVPNEWTKTLWAFAVASGEQSILYFHLFLNSNNPSVPLMAKIQANEIKMVDVSQIVPNPKNPNKHTREQIERLIKLIEFQGFRNPLIVSNRSGFLVAGHGRLQAAIEAGLEQVPVIYQDFENEAQEYAYVVSDNAVAEWASLDLSAINTEILDFGPEFDVDVLGIKDFTVDLTDKFEPLDVGGDEGERSQFILQIALPNELELRDLYDDLVSKGYAVREVKK